MKNKKINKNLNIYNQPSNPYDRQDYQVFPNQNMQSNKSVVDDWKSTNPINNNITPLPVNNTNLVKPQNDILSVNPKSQWEVLASNSAKKSTKVDYRKIFLGGGIILALALATGLGTFFALNAENMRNKKNAIDLNDYSESIDDSDFMQYYSCGERDYFERNYQEDFVSQINNGITNQEDLLSTADLMFDWKTVNFDNPGTYHMEVTSANPAKLKGGIETTVLISSNYGMDLYYFNPNMLDLITLDPYVTADYEDFEYNVEGEILESLRYQSAIDDLTTDNFSLSFTNQNPNASDNQFGHLDLTHAQDFRQPTSNDYNNRIEIIGDNQLITGRTDFVISPKAYDLSSDAGNRDEDDRSSWFDDDHTFNGRKYDNLNGDKNQKFSEFYIDLDDVYTEKDWYHDQRPYMDTDEISIELDHYLDWTIAQFDDELGTGTLPFTTRDENNGFAGSNAVFDEELMYPNAKQRDWNNPDNWPGFDDDGFDYGFKMRSKLDNGIVQGTYQVTIHFV